VRAGETEDGRRETGSVVGVTSPTVNVEGLDTALIVVWAWTEHRHASKACRFLNSRPSAV